MKCAFKKNGAIGRFKDAVNNSFKKNGAMGQIKDFSNKLCNTSCKCKLLQTYTPPPYTAAAVAACRAYGLYEMYQKYEKKKRG